MAITNGYCTAAELKSWLGITDATDDTILEVAIESVSRWIDDYCWRRFYKNTEDETRYYTAPSSYYLHTDDIVSITTLKTDDDGDRTYETTWATTDYDLIPYNATVLGVPYTSIVVSPEGS